MSADEIPPLNEDESWGEYAKRIHESDSPDAEKLVTLLRVLIEIGDEATYYLYNINESLQLRTTAKYH